MKQSTRTIKEWEKWQDHDPTDEQWAKLAADIKAGDRIEIQWNEEFDNMTDEGYVFEVPWSSSDSCDLITHVPNPNNPCGKDIPGPEWCHIRQLMANEYVVKIKKIAQ